MTTDPPDDRETRIDQAIAERQEARDAGQNFDDEAWLHRHPDLVSELEEFLGNETRLTAHVTAALPLAGGEFGRYRLRESLGRGSMGIVYRADDLRTGQVVALKLLVGFVISDEVSLDRFEREARLVAGLDQPGIVPLLESGVLAGIPYLAMPLIDGLDLSQLIRRLRSGGGEPVPVLMADASTRVRSIAVIGLQAARALAHAHGQGVVHRDIKPSNLLMDREGRVFLTDFGIARQANEPNRTTTVNQPGTYRYMAPEHFDSTHDRPVNATRGDIYALGLTLYELLTLRPAFAAGSTFRLIQDIQTKTPPRPHKLNASIPRDLERIILKAIEKEPDDRYPSAEALAADLERFLAGERPRATRVPLHHRVRSWVRRHPGGTLSMAGLILAALIAVAVVQSLSASESRFGQLLLEIQQSRAEPRMTGWSVRGWERVKEAATIRRDARLRDQAAALLVGLDAREVWRELDHGGTSVAFDAEAGRVLLGGNEPTASQDGRARILDRATGRVLHVSEQAGPGPVTFTGDGRPLQLVARQGSWLLWDVAKQAAVAEGHVSGVRPEPLALSPDGSRLAATTEDTVFVWSVSDPSRPLLQAAGRATVLAFSPDGRWLAIGDQDGGIRVAEIKGPRPPVVLSGPTNAVHALCFGRAPRPGHARRFPWLLAAGYDGGRLVVWDVAAQAPQSFFHGSFYDVTALSFAPDGMTLASGGRYETALWDIATGRQLLTLHEPDFLRGLAYSRDGRWLAATSRVAFGPAVRLLWEIEAGRGLHLLRGLSAPVELVVVSPDGRRIAALSQEWQVAVWDVGGPGCDRLLWVFDGPHGFIADHAALAFRPDGRQLAVATGREARLWDLDSGEVVRSWPLPPGQRDALAFPAMDKLVLSRAEREEGPDVTPGTSVPRQGRIRNLLAADSSQPMALIPDLSSPFGGASASPDGSLLVVLGTVAGKNGVDQALVAIDSKTDTRLWSIHLPPSFIFEFPVIDPTGTMLSLEAQARTGLASKSRSVLIDLREGTWLQELPGRALCIGALGSLWVQSQPRTRGSPERDHRLALRQGFTRVLLQLATDDPVLVDTRAVTFDRQGHRLIWGLVEGTVLVCDLETVRKRLAQLGLGY